MTSALRCLVGKFEALDAVSLPYQDPSLRPQPLQSARYSPQRKDGTKESIPRKLSTIPSPGSRQTSRSRNDDVFMDDYTGASTWGETPSSTKTTVVRSTGKQFQFRQMRMPQRSAKPSMTPSRNDIRVVSSPLPAKNKVEISPYVQNKPGSKSTLR